MDKDLRDDMLKLVRYKVLFVKRDYEHAFPEQEELVSENMEGAAFAAWKVAEFIQRLDREPIPDKWRMKGYPRKLSEAEKKQPADKVFIDRLDESDKEYLRVYYEVLDRYSRERFKYEERQIGVLDEIRDQLKRTDES